MLVTAHVTGARSLFHSASRVYVITSDIILIFSVPHVSCDNGPDMNANTHLPTRRHLPSSGHHIEAASHAVECWIVQWCRQSSSSHERVTNRLNFLEIMLKAESLERLHQCLHM